MRKSPQKAYRRGRGRGRGSRGKYRTLHPTQHEQQSETSNLPAAWQSAIDACKTVPTKRMLGQILDQLNEMVYPISALQDKICLEVLVGFSKFIDPTHDLIASKFCQLIATLSVRQSISYPLEEGEVIVKYLVKLVQQSHTWLKVDALRSLSYVLFEFAPRCPSEILRMVLQAVVPLSKLSNADVEIRRQALSCLGNACVGAGKKMGPYYKNVFAVLYENFENYTKTIFNDSSPHKLLGATLKALSCLIVEAKTAHVPHISEMVSTLRKLMCYGTSLCKAPLPSMKTKPELEERELHYSSDSDVDAIEGTNYGAREGVRIRIQSLQVLSAMAKGDFKSMFGEWKQLIPEHHGLAPKPRFGATLATVLLYDPSPKVRSAAAQTLITMFDNSRKYLAQADDSIIKSAFTPFSNVLANMLKEMHITLVTAVEREGTISTLVNIIRCLSVLIQNTPHEKLSFKLLPRIINLMLDLALSSVEKTVQVAALNCLGSVFDTKQPLKEIQEYLGYDQNAKVKEGEPQLLFSLLDLLKSNAMVTVECTQAISHFSRNYPECIAANWNEVLNTILKQLKSFDHNVKLATLQVINSFTANNVETGDSEKTKQRDVSTSIVTKEMWQQIADQILVPMMKKDAFHSIKVVICTIYSNMFAEMFTEMGKQFQEKAIELMYTATSDEAPSVRAAACRTLGGFATFPILREDLKFVHTLLDTIEPLLTDTILNVRVRACWALANLCDSIRQSKWKAEHTKDDQKDLLLRVLIMVLNCCRDNDKIRCNAVRALGNIANFVYESILNTKLKFNAKTKTYSLADETNGDTEHIEATEDIILNELVSAIGKDSGVKVRWNACYALGNMLNNKFIHKSLGKVIDGLCNSIESDENFKVRINASLALSIADDYGIFLPKVWHVVIKALTDSKDYTDFKEYRYLKTLTKQLRTTFYHIIDLTNKDNYHLVKDYLIENSQTILQILLDALKSSNDAEEIKTIRDSLAKMAALYKIDKSIDEKTYSLYIHHSKEEIFEEPIQTIQNKKI